MNFNSNFYNIHFFLIIICFLCLGLDVIGWIKKYEVIIIMLFIVFLIFVFSEGMLFISFFWASFHSSCSPIIEEILYVPDPCELTYTNTLILSNAALSLGCAFICRESNQNLSIISFILAWTFILLQLKEFRNMAFYINDSIFGSIFFFLTGLHFFHVVVGIILISIILGIVSIVSLPPASPNQATLHRLCDAGRRGSDDGNDRHPKTSISQVPDQEVYSRFSLRVQVQGQHLQH